MSREVAKGTAWASACRDFLVGRGLDARRLPLGGEHDEGDLAVGGLLPLRVECKNQRTYALAPWLNQAEAAAAKAGALSVVWAHRKGKSAAGDGYVIMSGATFAAILQSVNQP